ncbi:hypothetical protein APHMUC_1118 [Anaplasma phagocytophilum str. ApMUC09]|uniref:Uncharacterized protein n=1 Tax=Anaplasma phagocytophilum str. ApMUC09 TaxID=1359152 RepID=A0A0F3NAD1_ANAPH|nr:hypothetical protein APHMUC_1118 [Anaplasma phagocytophilum str. ApMUC09]
MTAFCMLRLLQQETLLSGVCTRSCSGCFLVCIRLRRIT